MTAEIVNLRRARKAKRRTEAEATAETNRALFGRTKGEKEKARTEKERAETTLDGHRRDPRVRPLNMAKRSISIAGHRTSISLEEPFWEALQAIAAARGLSLPALVVEIDKGRKDLNLSAALRVATLEWYRSRAGDRSP